MNKIILTNQNTTKNLNPVKKESKKIKTKTDFTFETQTIHFDSTNKKEKSFDSYSSQQKEGKNDWKQKIQSKPVNYFDSVKNQYEKVNLQFKEDDSSFYNETNTYKSKFLKQNEQGAIFNLNEELILKSVHCKNIAPKINQNEVLYQNIFDGVDLKYTIESNQVKETLIINKKRENYEFEFEMQLNGLNAEYDEESNRILLSKDGQTKYWIASPFMIDAAYHQSEECEIQIEQIGDLLKIKCLADKNWINHNHRVFPVTIDPTIGISVEEPTIQVQYKKVANGIISDSNSPYVGYAENVYYSASILLNMSKCQAQYQLNQSSQFKLKIYCTPLITPTSEVLFDFNYNETNYPISLQSQIEIDMTKEIHDAIIELQNTSQSQENVSLTFTISLSSTIQALYQINNVELDEIKSNRVPNVLSYHKSFDMGIAGVYNFDLFGQSNYQHFDTMIANKALSIPITHYYNFLLYDQSNDFVTTLDDTTLTTQNYYCGKGWKTNLHQNIIKNPVYSPALNGYSLTYIDGKGYHHHFIEKWYYEENEQKVYVKKEDTFIDKDLKLKVYDELMRTHLVEYKMENDEGLTLISGSSLNNYRRFDSFKLHFKLFFELENSSYIIDCEDEYVDVPHFIYNDNECIPPSLIKKDAQGNYSYKNTIITPKMVKLPLFYDGYDFYTYAFEKSINIKDYENHRMEFGTLLLKFTTKASYLNPTADLLENDMYITEDIESISSQLQSVIEQIEELNSQEKGMYAQIDYLTNLYKDANKNSSTYEVLEAQRNQLQIAYSQTIPFTRMHQTLTLKKSLLNAQKKKLVEEQKRKINYYLQDLENNILGFDQLGKLIFIQDSQKNTIEIEYGIEDEKNKIIRVIGGNNKVLFHYNQEGLLEEIIDTRGRKILFSYQNQLLKNISYPTKKISVPEKTVFGYQNSKLVQVTNPFYKKLNWNNGIKMTIPETKITNSKVTINQDVEKTLVDISFNPMSGGINLYDNTPKGQSEPLYYSDEKDYLIYEEDGHSVHCVGSNNKLFFKAKEKKSFITFDYSSGLSTIEKTIQIVDEENEETDGVLQVQRSSLLNTNFGLLSLDLHYLGTSPYHIELKVIVDYGNGRTSQFSFSYHSSFRFISCPFTFLKGAVKSISFQLQSDVTLSFITGKMSSSEGIINVYDEEGKLYQQFDGANQRTYLYQKNGLPYRVYIKDQDGNETIKQYSFDENNQLKLELDSKGNYTEYFTDSESNETKVRSYSNKHLSLWSESETIQEKDNESMVQSDALFENVKTQSFYHPASQLLEKYIDERGQIYRYGYEPFKDYQAEISTIVNQSRIYNKFEYNFDLLTKISHPGTSFYYEYDEQERIRKVSVGNQELWSIEYSTPTKLSDNIIITKTNNKNEKIITHYSQDGYLQYTQSLTYNYDSQHNVTSIYNEFEHYNFSYDENNRIIKQENSVSNYYSNSEEYIYDEDKLVKTIFKDLKKNTEKVFTYEYDENNHLTNVGFNSNQFDLALDDQNRISKETFTIPNKLSMIKEYSYVSGKQTELPLVHSSCTTINDTLIFNHSYLYDASQNITSNQDELGITRYHYDGINRLVREDNHHFGKSFQYEYDQAGNVLSKKEFDYTLEDTLVHPTAVYTYAYQNENWKDQLSAIYKNGHIQFKNVYDSMGNPTSYKGNTLVWNKDLITKYNTMQFEYDGNRKLIKTTYNNVGTYYHITDNKIQQMNIGNNILMFYYVLDKLVQFSYNNIVYTYLTNEWNDITHILDENGNVVASYVYDAWGNHQVYDADGIENKDSTFIGNINPFRYRGYLYFKEIQLYFLSSRFYDPDTGRFLSPDSYSFLNPNVIHGLNLYAYCFNNPVMYADPSGHIPKWLAWLVSGAAIVGGILLSATGIGGVLGGVLIGAGAGSLINGYVTEANGGDFTAGYIGGVISGALCGLGAGLGGMAFAAASEATNFACIGYMALGVTTSFVGGFAGNLAGTVYTSWHNSGFTNVDINWEETLMTSLIMGSLNIFAGMGAAMSSIAGSMARVATDLNSKLALRILAGIIAGGTEAAYDLVSYLIGTLISTF